MKRLIQPAILLGTLAVAAPARQAEKAPDPVPQTPTQTLTTRTIRVPVNDDRPRPGLLIREGALLVGRQGWVKPVGADRWAFVFDRTADGKIDPPMAMSPCLRLTEMRRIVEARPETVTFKITGRVFVYKGRNFLLPTFFTTLAETTPGQSTIPGGPAPRDLTPAEADAAKTSLDDLFGQSTAGPDDAATLLNKVNKATPKETAQPATKPGDKPTVAPPGAPGAPGTTPGAMPADTGRSMREEEMIVAKRGRLLRGGAGELTFAPDSGTDGPEMGPMRLLPCLNLQEMDRLSRARSLPLQFKVSGEVFVYEGRNYLLPTMYLIESDREGNVTPGQ